MSVLFLWSLRASGVIAVGLLLALALRGRSAALRNLVLRLTLAVACALPALVAFAPRVEVPLAPPALAPAVPRVPPTFQTPTPITEGWSVVQPDPRDPATLGLQRVTPFSTAWVPAVGPFSLIGYVGMGFLVLRWLTGMVRIRRLRHAATPTDAPDVWRTAIAVPATYGRTILVPLESADWPEARLHAAILHERAHIARRDWHWQTLSAGFAALHWANPLAWLLARALRDSAEAAADDAVLAQGVPPSTYARELLAVAAKVGHTGPALAMARKGGVKDRVAAVLSAKRDRRTPTLRSALALLAALLVAALTIAGFAPSEGTHRLRDGTTVRIVRLQARGAYVPSVPLSRGGWPYRLQVIFEGNTGDVAAKVLPFGNHSHTVVRIVEMSRSLLTLDYSAPDREATQQVRLALASGPWKPLPGRVPFRIGHHPGPWLEFDFPEDLRGRNFRLVATLKSGRRIPLADFNLGPDRLTNPMVSLATAPGSGYAYAHAENVSRLGFEFRPYEILVFRNVPVMGKDPIYDRRSQTPRSSALLKPPRLIGLLENASEGMRAWKPDGTPLTTLDPARRGVSAFAVPFAGHPRPGYRTLALMFRAEGRLVAPEFEAGVTIDAPDHRSSTTYSVEGVRFRKGSRPGEATIRGIVQVPARERVASVWAGMSNGPWTTHARMATDRGTQQGSVVTRKVGGAEYVASVTPNGAPTQGDFTHHVELLAVDAQGKILTTMRTVSWQKTYSVPLRNAPRVAMWTLRSRPLQTLGYAAHLWPNP